MKMSMYVAMVGALILAAGCGENGDNGEGPCGPNENIYVDVTGSTKMWPSPGDPVGVDGLFVGPVSPFEALANPDVEPFTDTLTGQDGSFSFECLDVTDVARGLVILIDDANFDHGAGDLFPTATGIVPWRRDSQKKDVEGAVVNALPNPLVDQINDLYPHDIRQTGFMMGIVWDSEAGQPIQGATITNRMDLEVKYPNDQLTDWNTEDSTSESGVFLLMEESRLNMFYGHADGYTFTDHEGGTQLGFCYFMVMNSI